MARFVIGTWSYPTKEAARTAVRKILNSAELDRRLVGDRAVFISHLFALHPRAAEKALPGVDGHGVRINDLKGIITRGFHVLHPGLTSTPWSYQPCFNPLLAEPSAIGAMRASIILSQAAFRRSQFGAGDTIPCACCKEQVTRKAAHVNHEAPNQFRELVRRFIERYGEPEVVSSEDFGDDFRSARMRALWLDFHDTSANRVVVCAPCNYAAERMPEPVC